MRSNLAHFLHVFGAFLEMFPITHQFAVIYTKGLIWKH